MGISAISHLIIQRQVASLIYLALEATYLLLKHSTIAKWRTYTNVLINKRGEQAEVGQSPTLLAICSANGVLRIPPVYYAPRYYWKSHNQYTLRYTMI